MPEAKASTEQSWLGRMHQAAAKAKILWMPFYCWVLKVSATKVAASKLA